MMLLLVVLVGLIVLVCRNIKNDYYDGGDDYEL